MKAKTYKCSMCGKDYPFPYTENIPETCGNKVCVTNLKYQKQHKDALTGKMPSSEDIKKW